MAKYYIHAKRRNSKENWSDWTTARSYPEAVKHAEHAKEVGYDSQIVPEQAVTKLWEILGEDKTELTDKIIDSGFVLYTATVNQILYDFKKAIHDKAVYPHNDEYAFVNLNVFDAVLQNFIRKVDKNAK